MKCSHRLLCFGFALLAAVGVASNAEQAFPLSAGEPGPVGQSLANEARAAMDRGTKWLLEQQSPEGHWSNKSFPALTALPLWALVKSGGEHKQAVDTAVKYVVSCAREDGSIWREPEVQQKGGGLPNYNTAICMVALHLVGDPSLTPLVQKARRFVAATQHVGGDDYRGGMGYDKETGRPYADLSNSYVAYEAMRMTEGVEDLRAAGEEKADLDWQAAREFLDKVQNKPGEVGEAEAGGFKYHPGESKAGTATNEEGAVVFRSYGSMTYAGLLSLIYAEVGKEDPRIQSAYDWAGRHWTLDENPGMGQEGLYYFYSIISKALAAFGREQIAVQAGGQVNWRSELIRKLVSLQKTDPKTGSGYWVNESNRWWESDPVLVTSYSLIALEIALGE